MSLKVSLWSSEEQYKELKEMNMTLQQQISSSIVIKEIEKARLYFITFQSERLFPRKIQTCKSEGRRISILKTRVYLNLNLRICWLSNHHFHLYWIQGNSEISSRFYIYRHRQKISKMIRVLKMHYLEL
jgi:hypothetical protein